MALFSNSSTGRPTSVTTFARGLVMMARAIYSAAYQLGRLADFADRYAAAHDLPVLDRRPVKRPTDFSAVPLDRPRQDWEIAIAEAKAGHERVKQVVE